MQSNKLNNLKLIWQLLILISQIFSAWVLIYLKIDIEHKEKIVWIGAVLGIGCFIVSLIRFKVHRRSRGRAFAIGYLIISIILVVISGYDYIWVFALFIQLYSFNIDNKFWIVVIKWILWLALFIGQSFLLLLILTLNFNSEQQLPETYNSTKIIADSLNDDGQVKKAIKYYEHCLILSQTRKERRYAIGSLCFLYSKTNQCKKSVKMLEELMQLGPNEKWVSEMKLKIIKNCGSIKSSIDKKAISKNRNPITNILKTAKKSVVTIFIYDDYGRKKSLGSGFYISPGLVATNYHVIEHGTRGFVKSIGTELVDDIIGIESTSKYHDLAIIKTTYLLRPSLKLEKGNVEIGDDVFVIGSPKGLEGTISTGIVSSIRGNIMDQVYQITAPISQGSSGGPVLNDNGKVIGITVSMIKDGQNLNFAVPVKYLVDLIPEG